MLASIVREGSERLTSIKKKSNKKIDETMFIIRCNDNKTVRAAHATGMFCAHMAFAIMILLIDMI